MLRLTLQSREVHMRWPMVVRLALLLLALSGASPAWGADEAQPAVFKPRTGITVWDTGRPSAEGLALAALAGKNDWTAIATDKTLDSFQGDAVLSNGRIVAVLRQQDVAVEIHAVTPAGAVARVRLRV